jgi:hypothetical protein
MKILTEAPVENEPGTPSTDAGEQAVANAKGEEVFKGDFYCLLEDKMGHFILIRLADGADAYFQGDDADKVEEEYQAMDKKFEDDAEFTKKFDEWAQQYDEILEV